MTTAMLNPPAPYTLRLASAMHSVPNRLADMIDNGIETIDDPESDRFSAVLVAVIVLLGVFVIVGAVYLYICTRAGYSRVSVTTKILKKWGIPYGIKGWIYCS